MNPVRTLRHFAGFLLAGTATFFATAVGQPPAGLDEADWARLRSTLDVARHRIAATAGGHQAHNPGQRWRTRFEGQGFLVQPDGADWQWGLELTAYGFPGREHTVPTGSANTLMDLAETRLEYAWDAGLSEWFVNDARGLEHGFTVHERPAGHAPEAPLNFHLAVRGGLRPVLEPDRHGVRFVDTDGTTRTTYAGLKVWDADGRILPAHFAPLDAGRPAEITLTVDERGARYPLTIDPLAQQAYLKASNTGAGDRFGISVAISGDTLVVGAPFESSQAVGVNGDQANDQAFGSGAAYVFVRQSGVWTQQAYLKASNTGPVDAFGSSVAISGDTIVIGASGEDSSATGMNGDWTNNRTRDSGAAYVFVRSGTTWTQQAYLKPAAVGTYQVYDLFGSSVAVSGDTVVVGAVLEGSDTTGVNSRPNENAFSSGAAYVFVRSGTTWTQQAYLKPAAVGTTQVEDFFGYSVAVSGDTVVVGAPGEDSDTTGVNSTPNENTPLAGAAYVFVRSGTTWTQQAYLKPAAVGTTQVNDLFGSSVAVSGDTVVVGARFENSDTTGVNSTPNESAAKAGAAYIFEINDRRIRVEQPAGVGLTGGASIRSFGAVSVGGSVDLTFTVRNSGTTNLTDFALSLDGTDANEFSVTANPTASLAPGESTTFTVRFSPTREGTKTATLHLASNDPVQNPFDLTLVGTPNVPTVAASGNDLTVSFVGTPGSRYRVQYLPGLTGSWTDFAPPALYTVPASGVFSHTDLNPPDTLRLYRAVSEP